MEWTTLIGVEDLNRQISDPNWVVVDCRFSLADPSAGRELYEVSHLPGARFADLDQDLSSPIGETSGRHPLPDVDAFTSYVRGCGIGPTTQVVAYDQAGGPFAARFWWLMRWIGHTAVAVLDGGYQGWIDCGHDTTPEVPRVAPAQYEGRPNDKLWVPTPELEQSLGSVTLIDAREADRFRGEREPIDEIAGHIPGAENLCFQENLDEACFFLPASQLRSRFAEAIGAAAPETVVHMCGSGVTACHNLLAMEIAGLTGSRLYPGSWSEWIRGGTRGVATGAT